MISITHTCRFCGCKDIVKIADLGHTAISNAFVFPEQDEYPETIYPLKLYFCPECYLVQIEEFKKREDIFNQSYVYFSSISKSWLKHSRDYVESIIPELKLTSKSRVVEIASNDGYLLQYFKDKKIPCVGIEPTLSTASEARIKGIETICEFFNTKLAIFMSFQKKKADLIVGNNVLPHDPNLNDFMAGLKILLKKEGTITLEFPHLLKMIENYEFDTIYQEHFSYFSILALSKICKAHGLKIYKVLKLKTHGGSLRVYIKHKNNLKIKIDKSVKLVVLEEKKRKLNNKNGFKNFQKDIIRIKYTFLKFLIDQKNKGKKIVAFGAAAKGNTFINYCGIKGDTIEYVVDETPVKQGKLLPQSHIPVVPLVKLEMTKPDYIVIIPWNFKEEIAKKLEYTRKWGAKLVTYIPNLEIF